MPASVCNTSLPQLLMMLVRLDINLLQLQASVLTDLTLILLLQPPLSAAKLVHGSHFVLTKHQYNLTPPFPEFYWQNFNSSISWWHMPMSGKRGQLHVYYVFLVCSKKWLHATRTSLQLSYVHQEWCTSHDLWKQLLFELYVSQSLTPDHHQYLLQHNHNSCRLHQRKQSNTIIRLQDKNSDYFVVAEKCLLHSGLLHLEECSHTAKDFEKPDKRLKVCECVCCRRMVSQAAMRGQRVAESECRCWNPVVWLLVSLLGSLVLVAVSVLLRLGECEQLGVGEVWGRGVPRWMCSNSTAGQAHSL